MSSVPTVLLATVSLLPAANGIARVARLMARVLADEARCGRLQARAIALSDVEPASDLEIPIQVYAGARLPYVLACQVAALRCSHFIYDMSGMARAHPWWFLPRRKSLVWNHGSEGWEHARRNRLRAFARSDVVLSNSAYTTQRSVRTNPQLLGARLCWLGTEAETDPAITSKADGVQNVLILGRIDPEGGAKGHRELIDCWPRVVRKVPNARLLIAGGGPGSDVVRAWVAQSGAADHVDVLGFVPERDLPELWSRTTIFAMPARREGFGISYIEAMRFGVPVIASIHDAGIEINAHGVSGYNVNLDDPDDLPTRLIELLTNPTLARRLGHNARARWQAHFRYSAFRQNFGDILSDFLATS